MKPLLAASIALLLSCTLAAQRRQTASATPVRQDLTSMLLDLDRTSAATAADISHLHIEKWKGGWKTGFTVSSQHKQRAEQAAASLQRNLQGALPDLIKDALASRNISATFKVYEDLSLVCETLDSLVTTAEQFGNKNEEYAHLASDFTNLTRLRRNFSAVIKAQSAQTDAGSSGMPYFAPANSSGSSSTIVGGDGDMPRRIIVDDTVQDKKSAASATAKKKPSVQYTNMQ
jgi:hypothetical protein